MEDNDKKEKSLIVAYPKNNGSHSTSSHKQRKPSANKKFIKNPKISFINLNSHFIYSEDDFKLQIEKLKNKNLIKLSKKEEDFLKQTINEIALFNSLNKNEFFVEINMEMYKKISNFHNNNSTGNELTNYIKQKIETNKNRIGISCRKLATSYLKDTGKYVGKSTVQKIIRHKLGYRYLKTVKKSNYLITDPGISSCLVFIKVIIKALILFLFKN